MDARCQQISNETMKFTKHIGVKAVAAYGGTQLGEQLGALKRGCEIVVATPGRLLDVLTISNGKVLRAAMDCRVEVLTGSR